MLRLGDFGFAPGPRTKMCLPRLTQIIKKQSILHHSRAFSLRVHYFEAGVEKNRCKSPLSSKNTSLPCRKDMARLLLHGLGKRQKDLTVKHKPEGKS